ncbi:fatty acid desaturase [Trinickia sp. LjRoot230]|uniref:fatty acid desaturase n=1 Tax=Trinickia sp. LjRoot230 TaxID=3342288 RepID=UPI003ECC987D
MLSKIFRNPIDLRPAALIAVLFAVLLAIYFGIDNVWLMMGLSILLLPARLSVVGYNHNHIHCLTFVDAAPNRLLEIMMFFETGTTPFSSTLNHIVGHHAHYFEPELDTLNWRRADGSMMGHHEFSLKAALWHYPSCIPLSRGRLALRTKFIVYAVLCVLLLAALIAYKPVAALIVFVVPMLLMLYMLKYAAYAHHSGLPIGDDFSASRTNTGKLYNWLTWNAGYHAAHHIRQALHWSELPAFHAELAHRMPAQLQGNRWGSQFSGADRRARPQPR